MTIKDRSEEARLKGGRYKDNGYDAAALARESGDASGPR